MTGLDPIEKVLAETKQDDESSNPVREALRKEINAYKREFVQSSSKWPRILSPPEKKDKHVNLTMCLSNGTIQEFTATKPIGPEKGYKYARKAFWGDLWPFPLPRLRHIAQIAKKQSEEENSDE